MAQELGGPLQLPLGHQIPDVGGGDGDAVLLHLLDDVAAQPQLPALGPQPVRIAAALIAKVKVVAGHHMDHVQLLQQIFGDKILPVHALHGLEGGNHHLLDSVALPHQKDTVLHCGQQRDGLSGDDGGGAAVEGEGAGDGLQPVRRRLHGSQQRPVAQMHPVKKAQGDDSFLFVHNAIPL